MGGGGGSQALVSRSGYITMAVECLVAMAVGAAYCLRKAVIRATRRPSSCSFEGRYAPRSTDPRTNDENTCPHNSESAQYEGRSNAESTNLQVYGEEGSLGRPRSSASTPRGDNPPELGKGQRLEFYTRYTVMVV